MVEAGEVEGSQARHFGIRHAAYKPTDSNASVTPVPASTQFRKLAVESDGRGVCSLHQRPTESSARAAGFLNAEDWYTYSAELQGIPLPAAKHNFDALAPAADPEDDPLDCGPRVAHQLNVNGVCDVVVGPIDLQDRLLPFG